MSNIIKILNDEMRSEKILLAHYKKQLREDDGKLKEFFKELIRRHESCIFMLRRIAMQYKKNGG